MTFSMGSDSIDLCGQKVALINQFKSMAVDLIEELGPIEKD